MTFLSSLTSDQLQTVIRLPYRVGLWVSRSDLSGGTDSDREEIQAITNIIYGFAEDMFGAETVQHIISATIRQKHEWSRWEENLENVPAECTQALGIVRSVTGDKDAAAFRNHLMEIATAVAMAFREGPPDSLVDKIIRLLPGRKNDYANISRAESRALGTLSKALEAA